MPLERIYKEKDTNPFPGSKSNTIVWKPQTSSGSEVIPDSEEELFLPDVNQHKPVNEVIEISSGSESEIEVVNFNAESVVNVRTPSKATKPRTRHTSRRRIIETSDEEDEEPEREIIEISDSSEEIIPSPRRVPCPDKSRSFDVNDNFQRPVSPNRPFLDESIIILDEPRSARTPLRVKTKDAPRAASEVVQEPTTPKKKKTLASRVLLNNKPGLANNPTGGQETGGTSAVTPRRNTKKARQEAELQKLRDYAQRLFTDLNKSVFKEGIPNHTKLNWSKRLLTTAGKAKYHRSREGVQTVEIELAEKILDCEDRIRNTLSHEMCHLATWIIDQKIDEHHGKLFKSWAAKVMKKHPDIDVSASNYRIIIGRLSNDRLYQVKHNYEISYPYQWKCEKCSKIYGRFSKSIKPEECVCGACKQGTLIPQFITRRKPNTPKASRMAAVQAQDSPLNSPSAAKNSGRTEETDSDAEVVFMLTKSLASTHLT